MIKKSLILMALLAGAWTSSATVTVQGWWHYGEVADYYADSSGNGYRFGSAFSRVGSGNAGAGVEPFGCGGPLGNTGFVSTNCLYWTPTHANAAGMWAPGYNPPATNYTLECWCIPQWPGTLGGNGAWLFCSGSSGGVRLRLTNDTESVMTILAEIVGNNTVIGTPWTVDSSRWTHLAIVNNKGANTFYVDGVQQGPASDPSANTIPSGDIYAGSAPGTQPTYEGFLDELRICTFTNNAFSTTDLLLRAFSPNIITQPQSASVWNGGAAPFTVGVATDTSTTYQWQQGGANIAGANASEFYLNVATSGQSGNKYDVVLNNSLGGPVTSSSATLTVVPVQTANVAAYQGAVTAESSLLAYFPGDGDTGSTLTDVKGANNGGLEGTAEFDGRTTRSFGIRALRLKNTADGDATIPNNPAYEFPSGNGTIEAIVYLDTALNAGSETILAETYGSGDAYYQLAASSDGSSLIYFNDSLLQSISWAVPTPLLGRLAHVALVFSNNTVTAYVDGLPLGTQAHPSFGSSVGASLYIGSMSLTATTPEVWSGSIDELAIYGSALSANDIAIHNSKFLYGTNASPPTLTVLPPTGTKNLLAGGSASFTVAATGTAPLSYQWKVNGSPILGANSATLTLSPTTIAESGTYGVTVSNPYGTTNSPTFGLTFTAPSDKYGSLVMQDNPMAYWRLGETTGTTAFDSAGGHDGAYSGAYTMGVTGLLPNDANPAVHFTGGHVQVPYSKVLNPATAFSVEFWANPDNEPSATYTPMGSQYRSGSAREGWAFYDENDALSFETQLGNASGVAYYAYGGGPEPFGGTWYHVVEVWDGTNNSTLYVENQVAGHNTQVGSGGVYVPNPSAPLMIGVRNDGSYPFQGEMDEVAVYNYALSPNQISNHWSIKFAPAVIVTQPVGATNGEGGSVTLTVVASGFPLSYQWQMNNAPLNAAPNPDGTQHYTGINSASLTIAEATPADSGLYSVVVSTPLPSSVTSTNVHVLITPDTNPPVVASVKALGTPSITGVTGPYLVKVTFNKRVDQSTAQSAANYAFSGGVTFSSPTLRADIQATSLGSDWKTLFLTTSGLTPGQKYTLGVSGVQDQATTPNTLAATNVSFFAPPLTPGYVWWDFYYEITPQAVSSLVNSSLYPSEPATNWWFTAFDSDQITGGDLNNDPAFGSLGDNYGDSLSAWITPTVTGNYTFFLASDDNSELDLSTDYTVANATMIAYEPGCCHGFVEPTSTTPPLYTSSEVFLTAGNPYFIRALHTEGGGGDYVKVAWRLSTDSTPAASLSPIPGQYLSSYVLLPPVFNAPVLSNNQLTISWVHPATLLQSTDLKTWTPVPGNPTSPYQITVNGATPKLFYRLEQ